MFTRTYRQQQQARPATQPQETREPRELPREPEQTQETQAAYHHRPRPHVPPAILPRPPVERHGDVQDSLDDHDDDQPARSSRGAADSGAAGAARSARTGLSIPVTACFNCRALRQKCDRKMPCARCTLRSRPCRYPSGSNRGRKHGNSFLHSTQSATVDRLLARIGETAERDQVVAALLNFAGATQNNQQQQQQQQQHNPRNAAVASSSLSPSTTASPPSAAHISTAGNSTLHHGINMSRGSSAAAATNSEPEFMASFVSPLHIMAAAVTADTAPYNRGPNSPMAASYLGNAVNKNRIDERLSRYFATQTTHQRDWQVLAAQPIDSPLKLEMTTCDPVEARLIDRDDVAWYFKLFFKYRGPLIGLLDPLLHTPDYVHATSFVLFSVLCALGCGVSDRPRDRVVYPALLSLAEANMKWAIAVCVKSLEAVQSIIIMQYWAPVCRRQSDDPYWLRLSHAVQLARELGIHRASSITEQVNARMRMATGSGTYSSMPNSTAAFKERLFRNFERTWLYTFISDKGFGIITGRSMGVPWQEIPAAASEWWRKPLTGPVDRIVSGTVEMRYLFLQAMEQRSRRVNNTLAAVAQWHEEMYTVLEQTRHQRCKPSLELPECPYLPVLAFYMDHSIMVLNAQTLRDLIAIDTTGTSHELLHLSAMNVDIASRLLDTMLYDPVLLELMVGCHNNQLIMVCHAATEIIYAIQRGGLPLAKVDQAAAKVRLIPSHLERIAVRQPTTSAVHLYASLAAFFVCQLDKVVRNNAERYAGSNADQGSNNSNNSNNSNVNAGVHSTADTADEDDSSASGSSDAHGPSGRGRQNDTIGAQPNVHATASHPSVLPPATASSVRALTAGVAAPAIVEPDQDSLLADWWRTVDGGGLLDSTTWMDMGFLSSEQPILGSSSAGGGLFGQTGFQ